MHVSGLNVLFSDLNQMKLKILKLFSLADKPEINAQLELGETFNFCI